MATPPRQIVAGQVFEVSSRCISRRFFLPPTREVTNAFLFIVGHYAQKHGIKLYALALMANHYHLKGLDVHGQLPHFVRDVNAMVARLMNAHHARDDKFWSGDGYHVVRPVHDEDVWRRLMYVSGNPVAADLVSRTEDYPGFVTTPGDIGRTLTYERPSFFREEGVMPDTVDVVFEVPEQLHLSLAEYKAKYRIELTRVEARERRRRRSERKTVAGAEVVRRVRVGSVPLSPETWFKGRGDFACKCKKARDAAYAERKAFLDEYAVCRSIWREDQAGVMFPPGTWWVKEFAGVVVRGPD
ncbi:MAG: hypothetical protein ACJAYU_002550 [Bradymonadia bacterium]|jgi:hypothetical protein